MANLTYRHFISMALLVLAGVALLAGFRVYQREEATGLGKTNGQTSAPAEGERIYNLKEMIPLLEKPSAESAHYKAVAEKNLFSPDRKAWAPAMALAVDTEGKDKKEPKAKVGKSHDHVILHGTSITAGSKEALIGFKRLKTGGPARFVKEGESITGEYPRKKLVFTLMTVAKTSVVLKDEETGETFQVVLFKDPDSRTQKTINKTVTEIQTGAPGAGIVSESAGSTPAPAKKINTKKKVRQAPAPTGKIRKRAPGEIAS